MYRFIFVLVGILAFPITECYNSESIDADAIWSSTAITPVEEYKGAREISTTPGDSIHAEEITENQFAGRSNESDFSWLDDALKDIAYYLRAHKFNEYDRRYQRRSTDVPRDYFRAFPRPPLRSLHWEVHKFCEQSFLICVEYLMRRVRNAGLKRTDDTSIVIQQQHWNKSHHSKQIDAVENECRKMLEYDDKVADPFQGPIERFQWRTTASYYMCWYTMNKVSDLKVLKETCDNFGNCLDMKFGVNNKDPRANDDAPFACSLYSFCPDPCCPFRHLNRLQECWDNEDNPCFAENPAGQRECAVKFWENTNFPDIVLNRWNVTCKCPQAGFAWDSKYGMCVDKDECAAEGFHGCDPKREACVNLPGTFRCACQWGFVWNSAENRCEPSPAVEIIRVRNAKPKGEQTERKASSLVKRLLNKVFGKNCCCRKTRSALFALSPGLIAVISSFGKQPNSESF